MFIVATTFWCWHTKLVILSCYLVWWLTAITNAILENKHRSCHYYDVITESMASQITSLTIVYSTVYLDAYQRKYQSSASLAFVRGNHRVPMNSLHKWPLTRKMSPFDDVIMYCAGRGTTISLDMLRLVYNLVNVTTSGVAHFLFCFCIQNTSGKIRLHMLQPCCFLNLQEHGCQIVRHICLTLVELYSHYQVGGHQSDHLQRKTANYSA